MRVKIAGVGSVLLGDDGVGPYTVCMLEAAYVFGPEVQVVDLGTPGLDLVAHMGEVDVLILIDAVKNDAAPGSVTVYRKDEILQCAPQGVRVDPHSPALSESILIAEFAGGAAPEILLLGITGEKYEIKQPITTAARNGARYAIGLILDELDRLGVDYSRKIKPEAPRIWWEPPVRAGDCTAAK